MSTPLSKPLHVDVMEDKLWASVSSQRQVELLLRRSFWSKHELVFTDVKLRYLALETCPFVYSRSVSLCEHVGGLLIFM